MTTDASATTFGFARVQLRSECDQVVERVAERSGAFSNDFGEGSTVGSQDGGSTRQSFRQGQTERFIPPCRHPETRCLGQQIRFALARHFTNKLKAPAERRSPSTSNHKSRARSTGTLDCPLPSLRRVQSTEEEIEVAFGGRQVKLARVEAIIDIRCGTGALGMVLAQRNHVRRIFPVISGVAVHRPQGGNILGRDRPVRVKDIDARWEERSGVELRAIGGPNIDRHQTSLGYLGAGSGQQDDLVSECRQPPREPDHNPLGAAVSSDRKDAVVQKGNTHDRPKVTGQPVAGCGVWVG